MSNFEKIAYENSSEELKSLYDEILSKLNTDILPNLVSYLGSNILILKGIWQMFDCTMLQGSLSPLLKEFLLFSVSINNVAPYCTEYHASNITRKSDIGLS